jgi:hypothetical protein
MLLQRVLSENSIRLRIRVVRQNHRMIATMLAVLHSLGMFIVDLLKSRRRSVGSVSLSKSAGRIVLLLCQEATVLQLPAKPANESEACAQERAVFAG